MPAHADGGRYNLAESAVMYCSGGGAHPAQNFATEKVRKGVLIFF